MQPRAVLVLYEPGHRFKNYKYLLSLGANVVGNDPKCQVSINSKQYFPEDYVANFFVTNDFMYIEALCDDIIQFKSNMQLESSGRKKDVYRHIEKNCRYVLQMEEIFYIGPYKAIVQVQSPQQLKQIKNLLNIENFQTPRGEDQVYFEKPKVQIKHSQSQKHYIDDNMDAKSDGTEKIDSQSDYAFAPTLEIDDNDPYAYEPTLLIDDQKPNLQNKISSQNNNLSVHYPLQVKLQQKSSNHSPVRSPYKSPAHSPLIKPMIQPNSESSYTKSLMKKPNPNSQVSEISMFSRQKQKKPHPFSQEVLYETIKKDQINLSRLKSNDPRDQEEDISMPDTIRDSQQQEQANIDDDDDFDMPPTIKDDELHPIIKDNQARQNDDDQMPPTIKDDENLPQLPLPKISKTMYENKPNKSLPLNAHLYKSQKVVNSYDYDEVQDDIFGLIGQSLIRKVDSNEIEIKEEKQQIREKKEVKKKSLIDSSDFVNFKNQRVLPQVKFQESQVPTNMMKSNGSVGLEKTSKQKLTTQKKSILPSNQNSSASLLGKKRLFKESEKPKLVNLTGFKPKAEDKLTLRQRGYQIVSDGKSQEYQLLIYGKGTEVSPKLLMAILLDKEIVTEDWIKDKDWEEKRGFRLEGTVQGISWENVNKQRGRRDIFKNAGLFYFTQTLEDLGKVFEFAGGNKTEELNKRKKINCVIECEIEADQKFYRENLNCKNWKFYSHKLINQSILLGQILFKKYIVDETSF